MPPIPNGLSKRSLEAFSYALAPSDYLSDGSRRMECACLTGISICVAEVDLDVVPDVLIRRAQPSILQDCCMSALVMSVGPGKLVEKADYDR